MWIIKQNKTPYPTCVRECMGCIYITIIKFVAHVYVYQSSNLSIYLSVCSCVCLYVCSCVCLFVCLSVRVSICLSICLSVCLSVCQYVCLSVCIFVFLYVCLSVCLYVCMKFLLLLKPVFVHYVLMCSCSCVLVHLSNLVSNLPLVLYPVTYIAVRHCTFIFVVLQES